MAIAQAEPLAQPAALSALRLRVATIADFRIAILDVQRWPVIRLYGLPVTDIIVEPPAKYPV
jgi:hypothetical protein